MKILCTADVHIGRRPSRLPERVNSADFSCARMWTTLVDRALSEGVDLVLVAGDLVDQANRYYEAVGPVEAGVRRLAARGIRTVAVAGNHDHDTLPWIASRFTPDEFRLLGGGGEWERCTITRAGRPALHIDGWSFPSPFVADDPLAGYPRWERTGVPVLGLLHGELEEPRSRHAPVTLAGLRALPVDFWLLGHIHRPGRFEQPGAATVLYPGSPQAMDPGEEGAHGAWLLELRHGPTFALRHVPLSGVRYDSVQVEVDGVEDELEVDRRVVDAVSARLREVEDESELRYLTTRVRLSGRTALHRRLQKRSWGELVAELDLRHGAITGLVERIEIATLPARDLDEIASGRHAPALLARLVRGLERGQLTPDESRLLRTLVARVQGVRAARQYLPLGDHAEPVSEQWVADELKAQALLLLDELLAEREVA